MESSLARRLWRVGEPVHAIIYFHPASAAAWAAAGIRGFWRGYFATRAAPFGAVDAGPVTATFYNFHPAMVARAVPEVWTMVTPADALAARLDGAAAALRDALGDDAGAADIAPTAERLRGVVTETPVVGRALFGANVALPWPDEPLLPLWHGLTLLREHRGDGHNAALLAHDIDGCGAHVLAAAVGGAPRDVTQPARGWTDDDWMSAADRLAARGLVDGDGVATATGRELHAAIERRTDELAAEPWADVDDDALEQIVTTLARLAGRVAASGTIRFPNPMGLPAPDVRAAARSARSGDDAPSASGASRRRCGGSPSCRREAVTPHLVRVTLGGRSSRGSNPGSPPPACGCSSRRTATSCSRRGRQRVPASPTARRPALRTLTPRRWDGERNELTVEIVLHGDGPLSTWAATVEPGAVAALSGTGRGYTIDPTVDDYLLAGDESALPAISVLLEALPPSARVAVLAEVTHPDARFDLPAHPGATVTWHDLPAGGPPGDAARRRRRRRQASTPRRARLGRRRGRRGPAHPQAPLRRARPAPGRTARSAATGSTAAPAPTNPTDDRERRVSRRVRRARGGGRRRPGGGARARRGRRARRW